MSVCQWCAIHRITIVSYEFSQKDPEHQTEHTRLDGMIWDVSIRITSPDPDSHNRNCFNILAWQQMFPLNKKPILRCRPRRFNYPSRWVRTEEAMKIQPDWLTEWVRTVWVNIYDVHRLDIVSESPCLRPPHCVEWVSRERRVSTGIQLTNYSHRALGEPCIVSLMCLVWVFGNKFASCLTRSITRQLIILYIKVIKQEAFTHSLTDGLFRYIKLNDDAPTSRPLSLSLSLSTDEDCSWRNAYFK